MAGNKTTKSDLVDSIYQNTSYDRQSIQLIVDECLLFIKEALKSGSTVELRGFGTFEPKLRAGRDKARNPRTGETLSVPPHYVASFRPGQDLRASLYALGAGKE